MVIDVNSVTDIFTAFGGNPLHDYQSYSYHISLRVAPELDGKLPILNIFDNAGMIVAETGKTAQYFIDRMEVKTTTPQDAAITTSITEFEITIVEQNGFQFIEKYMTALKLMNWQTPVSAIFYLDISFNGWKQDGNLDSKALKKRYRVNVTNIETELNEQSSRYILKAQPANLMAMEDDALTSHRPFRSEIKEQFIETVQEFETKLNEQMVAIQSATNAPDPPYDRYVLKVGSRLLENIPEPIMATINEINAQTFMKDSDGKLYYNYCGGNRIDEVLIKLASNIVGMSRVLHPETKEDETVDAFTLPQFQLTKQLRVSPKTSLGEFNPQTNSYQKIYTYTIDLQLRPDIDMLPPNAFQGAARIGAYFANGLMRRKYKYVFTGKNVDVLEANFDLNTYFHFASEGFVKRNTEYSHTVDELGKEYEASEDEVFTKKIPRDFKSTSFIPTLFGIITQIVNSGKLVEEIPNAFGLINMLNYKTKPTASTEKTRSGVAVLETPQTSAQSRIVNENLAKAIYQPACKLVNLELKIVGDPIWMDNNDLVSTLGQSDYGDKPQLLKFEMVSGQPPSSETGLPANIGRVNFNGYYFVSQVTSIFENGVFQQEITAQYDTSIIEQDLSILDTLTDTIGL